MTKNWIEIHAEGLREKKDEAAFFFIQAGSPGVLEEDNGGAVGRLVSHSAWEFETLEAEASSSPLASFKAYLAPDEPQKIARLRQELNRLGWGFSTSVFKDKDWSTKWRSGIKPMRISGNGPTVIIKPTWRTVVRRQGEIVIEIDPGMAFGTGSHSTTKMCLKAIKAIIHSKKASLASLLDVGTGTGILAIAAKRLGVRKVVGIDIDPVAMKVARKNASLNRTILTLSKKPVENIKGAFPIVVANILTGDLIRLSEPICSKVAPGGCLILSGILKEEAASVSDAYVGTGLKPLKTYSSKEWSALVFTKQKQPQ